VRGKLEFTPNDDVTFTLIADYTGPDDGPNGVVSKSLTPAFANALRPVYASNHNRDINTDTRSHVEDTNKACPASSTGNWAITP
jgi:iron complex outermembrane receptor protein